MNFQESLAFVASLEESRMRLDIEPSFRLLEALGRPDKNLTSVIVAGTNGKGSVCAYLTSIAMASDLKVGTYTSPHLESVLERIAVNGVSIDQDSFAHAVTIVKAAVVKGEFLSITYFEFLTMCAVVAFRNARVDLAIFEVGLGGRLDTTNALKRAGVVLTRIGFDHMSILGNTLSLIANEKAAIMRSDAFAVVSKQPPEAMEVFLAKAKELGVEIEQGKMPPPTIELGIPGRHQFENAASAIQASHRLKGLGFPITENSICNGLRKAFLPGRLELLKLRNGKEVLLDVAHNEDSAEVLAAYLREIGWSQVHFVIGMLKDKAWEKVIDKITPLARQITFCRPNSPRAWDIQEVLRRFPFATAVDSPQEALKDAIRQSDRIVCTGSFFVIGEIRNPSLQHDLMLHGTPGFSRTRAG